MNIVLLEPSEVADGRVAFSGRRLDHIRMVLRAKVGDEIRVGVIGGAIGTGAVLSIGHDAVELGVQLQQAPPPPLPLRVVLALPRPKVFDRAIASLVSMGVRQIDLINAWRVEKSYWESPRLQADHLRQQAILGLEQAGDTMLPEIRLHRLFTPFVTEELPSLIKGNLPLLSDPGASTPCPRSVNVPVTLVVGPEGGFIQRELDTFAAIGFQPVSIGRRILRVETALAYLVGRIF